MNRALRQQAKAGEAASGGQSLAPYWHVRAEEAATALGVGTAGVSSAEAELRLARFGSNVLHPRREQVLAIQFLARFRNPLVLVLLAASAISALTGEEASFVIIGLIVMASVTLDFIPKDRVDEDYVAQPRHWDMSLIRNFMLTIGPVSSVFDFLTFAALILLFHAGEALFQTGWFIESIATQVLVIFVIRTRGAALRSRPSALLVLSCAAVVGVAMALPFTPVAAHLGFVAPPLPFFGLVTVMTLLYLGTVEVVKRAFFRRYSLGPTMSRQESAGSI